MKQLEQMNMSVEGPLKKIHAFCDKWIKKMEYYLAGKQQNAI